MTEKYTSRGAAGGAAARKVDAASAAAHAAEQRAAFLTRLLTLVIVLDAAALHVRPPPLISLRAGSVARRLSTPTPHTRTHIGAGRADDAHGG